MEPFWLPWGQDKPKQENVWSEADVIQRDDSASEAGAPLPLARIASLRARWKLAPDGEPFQTHTSTLLPVRSGDTPAMLKIAHGEEERRGATVLIWWAGEGAARVLAHEDDAILMERATGTRSLGALAREGPAGDDDASRILCAAAARLHAPRATPPPSSLVPLDEWFAALSLAAETHGGVFARSLQTAQELLASSRDLVPLHGDLHHGNVLDFGDRGWLAIDPKGVIGERGYDFANIFCNPDAKVALSPGRLARTLDVVADAAGLERARLLRWALAYAGLSAAWSLEDGDDPAGALAVAEIAIGELER